MWILVAGLVIVMWAVAIHHGLVSLHGHADGAWADLEVQLKHRYELIRQVIEMVDGSATKDQKALHRLMEARARAMAATTPKDKEVAEEMLSVALKNLIAIVEQDPQVRAAEHFVGLQESLRRAAQALQGARRYYNAVVRDYNTRLMMFPDRLIARGLKPRDMFQLNCIGEIQ